MVHQISLIFQKSKSKFHNSKCTYTYVYYTYVYIWRAVVWHFAFILYRIGMPFISSTSVVVAICVVKNHRKNERKKCENYEITILYCVQIFIHWIAVRRTLTIDPLKFYIIRRYYCYGNEFIFSNDSTKVVHVQVAP